MAIIAKLIGGAGTGKTTELLRLLVEAIERGGTDPFHVGFVSFTRAARREASTRAGEATGVDPDDLEKRGWFKTLHAICHRALAISGDALLTDDKESGEWLDQHVGGHPAAPGEQEDERPTWERSRGTAEQEALELWHAARIRLVPDLAVFAYANQRQFNADVIQRYEHAKALHGRLDFTDLLARFAGWKFSPYAPPERCEPEGVAPRLPIWFFDEQQDTSPLLAAVCQRLIEQPGVRWVYMAGDPFQAIHCWAGSDPHIFLGWPATKEKTMPQSWRCPPAVMALGESVLRGECSYYFDRGIAPAARSGAVQRAGSVQALAKSIQPGEEWMFIARTNFQVARLAAALNRTGLPWCPTVGSGGWLCPVKGPAFAELYTLAHGGTIDGLGWQRITKVLPATKDHEQLLTRGTKKRWDKIDADKRDAVFRLDPQHEGEAVPDGATPKLLGMIRSGEWTGLHADAPRFAAGFARFGIDSCLSPSIRIGTIHSVKGSEAENVVLLTTLGRTCWEGARVDRERRDEEACVTYVGVTRAKGDLYLLHEPRERFRMRGV